MGSSNALQTFWSLTLQHACLIFMNIGPIVSDFYLALNGGQEENFFFLYWFKKALIRELHFMDPRSLTR